MDTWIAPGEEYRDAIGDTNWAYNPPQDMLAYDPDAVDLDDAERSQAEAIWGRKEAALEAFTGACNGAKELILYTVCTNAVIVLKKCFIGYGGSTLKGMIAHVQKNLCIKLTTKECTAFKTQGYTEPWDTTKSMSAYLKYLEDFKARLDNHGIKMSKEEIVDAVVTAM